MNNTKNNITKLLALVCMATIAQPGFCITLKPVTVGELFKHPIRTMRQVMQRTDVAKQATHQHVQPNSSPVQVRVQTLGRTYYVDPKAKALQTGKAVTALTSQEKAQLWTDVHGQGENVAPVFAYDKFEDAFIEYANRLGKDNMDRIDYLVPWDKEDLPDGPGTYISWNAPTSRMTITINGIATELNGREYVMMQKWDPIADKAIGPVRVYEKNTEYNYIQPYLKPIPLSSLQASEIPTDPAAFWEFIGGKKEYTNWRDLVADVRTFADLAPAEVLEQLRLGSGTQTTDYYHFGYDFYKLPVEEIHLGRKIYRQRDDVMVVRNDMESYELADETNRVSQLSATDKGNIMFRYGDDVVSLNELERTYENIEF